MNRNFKGVWISKEIWVNNELTWMEKLFITEINSLDGLDGCFASNSYFAEFFNISKGRCSQIISSLSEKKFISVELQREGKQIVKRVVRILNRGIKNSKQPIKNIDRGYLEYCEESNTVNNTSNKSIPSISEFLEYVKTKSKDFKTIENSAKLKFESWIENDWKDGNDKKIKNWKSKILNTIPHLKREVTTTLNNIPEFNASTPL